MYVSCHSLSLANCHFSQFPCNNGLCVSDSHRCDGSDDCEDYKMDVVYMKCEMKIVALPLYDNIRGCACMGELANFKHIFFCVQVMSDSNSTKPSAKNCLYALWCAQYPKSVLRIRLSKVHTTQDVCI